MIGLNITEAILLKQADRRAAFADIKSLGIDDIRVEFPWKLITSSYTQADAMMADAANAGLRVLGMIAHPPSPRPSPQKFGGELGALARRYPQIRAWEIWNEQNAERFWLKADPDTFAPYLKAAYAAIKLVDDTIQVVLGGLAACATAINQIAIVAQFPFIVRYTNYAPAQWLTNAYAAGIKGYFDVLGVHPYTWDAGFRWQPFSPAALFVTEIDRLRNVADGKGDTGIKIWGTEYGYPIDKFTAEQQASNLAAETAYLGTRIEKQFLYCYRDGPGGNFGLLDKNNIRRPAYNWLKGLAA